MKRQNTQTLRKHSHLIPIRAQTVTLISASSSSYRLQYVNRGVKRRRMFTFWRGAKSVYVVYIPACDFHPLKEMSAEKQNLREKSMRRTDVHNLDKEKTMQHVIEQLHRKYQSERQNRFHRNPVKAPRLLEIL